MFVLGVVRVVAVAGAASLLLAGCASTGVSRVGIQAEVPVVVVSGTDALIVKYAGYYGVPESLIRRIIVRESGYNPRAHHGPFWGLMQIRYDTAQSMGYRGKPSGLLDADVNLRYGVRYLRGAWLLSGGNADKAVRLYASGYYFVAKARGMLGEVGLR